MEKTGLLQWSRDSTAITGHWIFSKTFPLNLWSLPFLLLSWQYWYLCSFDPQLKHSSTIFNLVHLDWVSVLLFFFKEYLKDFLVCLFCCIQIHIFYHSIAALMILYTAINTLLEKHVSCIYSNKPKSTKGYSQALKWPVYKAKLLEYVLWWFGPSQLTLLQTPPGCYSGVSMGWILFSLGSYKDELFRR